VPRVTAEAKRLTLRGLNRALLARQGLLDRLVRAVQPEAAAYSVVVER
jgi:hypothetical protein